MEQKFKQEKVLVGKGKMAKVYRWNGFAYKCFHADYPEDWMAYEVWIQSIINQTGLPVARYYPSDFPHSIKMDYLDGITLGDKMRNEKYKEGLVDLFSLILKIHEKTVLELPRLNPFLLQEIPKVDLDSSQKELALQYISDMPDGDVLCHLDFHFLNVMCTDKGYSIIDWINAKTGNPIYDFARSYVIMYEFANRLSKKFLVMVKEQCKFDPSDWQKAIYVMAVHRLSECNSEKIKMLIHEIEMEWGIQKVK